MKALIQRVSAAGVTMPSGEERRIGRGLVVFAGIARSDTEKDVRWIAAKVLNLRIFPDDRGRFDRSILDIRGELLVVSQFTLFGDCVKGRRPDFTAAAMPDTAIPLYERLIEELRQPGLRIATGEFGADMQVEIRNDGPVTIEIDTARCTPESLQNF